MASVPTDGDDFETRQSTGQTDDWEVVVDIFDVALSFTIQDGNARLIRSKCNCDINSETCRHVAIAEGRVRAMFADESLSGVKGRITYAPALWAPIVDDDGVKASDTAVN